MPWATRRINVYSKRRAPEPYTILDYLTLPQPRTSQGPMTLARHLIKGHDHQLDPNRASGPAAPIDSARSAPPAVPVDEAAVTWTEEMVEAERQARTDFIDGWLARVEKVAGLQAPVHHPQPQS